MSTQGDGVTKPFMTFTDVLSKVQRNLVNLNSAVSQLSEVHKAELSYARAGLHMDPRPKPPMLKIPRALDGAAQPKTEFLQLSPESQKTSASPGCMGKLQFKLPQQPRVNGGFQATETPEVAEEYDHRARSDYTREARGNEGLTLSAGKFGPSPRQQEFDSQRLSDTYNRLSSNTEEQHVRCSVGEDEGDRSQEVGEKDGDRYKKVQTLRSEVSMEIIDYDKGPSDGQKDGEMVAIPTTATNMTTITNMTAASRAAPSIKRMQAAEDLFTLLPPVEPLEVWRNKVEYGMWPNGLRSSAAQPLTASLQEGPSRINRRSLSHSHDSFLGEPRRRAHLSRILIARPGSTRRLTWDILGMLLISYDLIILPFQVFEPDPNFVTEMMAWLTLTFWTLDIPSSFMVGFYYKGAIMMHAPVIAKRYLRGWFFFDVSVVTADWIITLLSQGNKATGVGQLKMGRALRFLRMMRLLRLLKVQGMLKDIVDRIRSEAFLILLGVVKLLLFISVVNHLIACGWYGMGMLGESFYNKDLTWIWSNDLKPRDVLYRYTTSLHWSWTQFTPASMEVVPVNSLERLYTVIILLFAMVTFSSFVSSITNAMTRLRNLDADRFKENAILRKYLQENHISMSLSSRIWGFLDSEGKKNQQKRTHEKDIILLLQLPWRLKDELLEQVYYPVTAPHPFFMQMQVNFPQGLIRCFRETLEELSMGIGHELFNIGGVGDRMFFLITGEMFYSLNDLGTSCRHSFLSQPAGSAQSLMSLSEEEAEQVAQEAHRSTRSLEDTHKEVHAGSWICEMPLWVPWKHRGQMTTVTYSELISIEALAFQKLCMTELGIAAAPKYAELFAKYMTKQGGKGSDVWDKEHIEALQDMAAAAFGDGSTPVRASWQPLNSAGVSPDHSQNSANAYRASTQRKSTLDQLTAGVIRGMRTMGSFSKSGSFTSRGSNTSMMAPL